MATATKTPSPFSAASTDLGLGGQLTQQVANETEEERKKRLAGMSSAAGMSPSVNALFGLGGIGGSAY